MKGEVYMSSKIYIYELLSKLNEQKAAFEALLVFQHGVYESVKEKNWTKLEENLRNCSKLSNEIEKNSLYFNELTGNSGKDIKAMAEGFSSGERKKIMDLYGIVRHLALKSKIENDCLNSYVRNMEIFLKDFFEAVVPSKKYYTYNAYGQKVKREVESLVLNKIL